MQEQDLPTFEAKINYLENDLLSCEDYSQDQKRDLKHKISYVKSEFKNRWLKANRKQDKFLNDNADWLQGTFEIPNVSHERAGRPSKPFSESSERTKRRKTEELRKCVSKEVLVHATKVELQSSGKRDASHLLTELVKSPKRATKYKKAYLTSLQVDNTQTQLTPLRALSMFVEADLSRRQYEIIRSSNKKLYPCYSVLQKAKHECYPQKESYRVTETCAEIKLQHLLNHTVTRLLTYLQEILTDLTQEERNTLELICKWGCDGSQQSQFKQKMQNNDASDSNIFQSCLVPLQLVCGKNKKRVIWQNSIPSSPRYCRPIRIRFVKETTDITNDEINYVQNQIDSLENSQFTGQGVSASVKHTMTLTMVDGKVCNAATQTTSTMRCYICGATSKQFNDLSIKKDVDIEALSFGLSILHARIRLFESILHLSYKLPVKKWQLRSEADKTIVKERKAEIQRIFRQETGLIVDVPKSGFGNTNDGNSSRRFFSDPQQASEITGVDFNLIYRLKIILEVISSGHKVDLKKFADYGFETAKLYIALYPWHPMTPTMHKILVHGATVMEKALLPIGMLSEEAAEARNKHFRMYRYNFARKFSREACNLDVLNRLLLTSDPIITSLRPKPSKSSIPFSKEAIEMLIPADPDQNVDDSDSDELVEEEAVLSEDEPWHSYGLVD